VVTALLGAGLLAALISTASGLLLTMSSAVSHDLFHKILDRTAPTSRRLVLSRFFVIIIAAAGAFTALSGPRDMMTLLAWSFSLAAAGLFPALCLGIWWKGCTSLGALAGMASGFAITLFYVVWTADAPLGLAMPAWLGIGTAAAGIFGLPVGFLVAYLVSRITPKPSEEVQHLVDEIRTPRGPTVVDVQIGGKRPQSW
jgi:cation/acetate symporter